MSCALQVGYISPDLFTHSVSYFAEAPLSHHRPDHVQLFVYNVTPKVCRAFCSKQCQHHACGDVQLPGHALSAMLKDLVACRRMPRRRA